MNAGMGQGLRRLNSEFTTKFISEAGSKDANKDYFGFVEMDSFACWAVAETYDNDEDVTSAQLAVDTVLDLFVKKPTLSKRRLKSYIHEAHRQLKEQSGKFQLKASIMIVASNYKKMRYAHCGNCRLYLFRGDNIFLKSHDQSLFQDMIDEEAIPDDHFHGIEESRNLFNFLGKQGRIKVEASKKTILYDDDILLLTTWGFWEKISILEMIDALEDVAGPMEYLDELQDLFLSKQDNRGFFTRQRKHVNNYTLATVFASKTFKEKSNAKKYIKIALMILIPLLIIGIVMFILSHRAKVKRTELINSINQYESQGDVYIGDENYDRALLEYDEGIKESKDLKETKGKKGEENNEIKDSINAKQRFSQLIIDGDGLFKNGEYDEAKLSYEKALKEAKHDMSFYDMVNAADIENKILLCEDYKYINDLITLADGQAELEQYLDALANYDEAKKLAVESGNKEAEKDLKLKRDDVVSKIKAEAAAHEEELTAEQEKEKEEKIKNIEKDVLEGDKAVTAGDYTKAKKIYDKAMADYTEMGEIDKASEVEKKIGESTEKEKSKDDDDQIKMAEAYAEGGDGNMLSNKFTEAIGCYKSAKDIYSKLKMTDDVAAMNEKISEANSKKSEAEVSGKILEATLVEAEGDKLLKGNDYLGAKEKYRQAQTLYQGLNQMDKVLAVQDKIKGVEEIEAEINMDTEKEKQEQAEKEKEFIIFDAQMLELQGDNFMKEGRYRTALSAYEDAKERYQKAEAYDKVIAVQEKIFEAERRIR